MKKRKFTIDEDDLICDILRFKADKDITQHVLKTIGKDHWSRTILYCALPYLTDEQNEIFKSLGGRFTVKDTDEQILHIEVRHILSRKLKQQGVTHFLYKNNDYLESIRNGETVVEGIDMAEATQAAISNLRNSNYWEKPFGWIDCDPKITYIKFRDDVMHFVVGTFSNHTPGRLRMTFEFFDVFGQTIDSSIHKNKPLRKTRYYKPSRIPNSESRCKLDIPYEEFDVSQGFHNILCKLKMFYKNEMLSECDFVLGHDFK